MLINADKILKDSPFYSNTYKQCWCRFICKL